MTRASTTVDRRQLHQLPADAVDSLVGQEVRKLHAGARSERKKQASQPGGDRVGDADQRECRSPLDGGIAGLNQTLKVAVVLNVVKSSLAHVLL